MLVSKVLKDSEVLEASKVLVKVVLEIIKVLVTVAPRCWKHLYMRMSR